MEVYRGNNFWDRLVRDEGFPPRHVHACPECYAAVPCFFEFCTLEPDLEQDDGTPCGAHLLCVRCNPTPLTEVLPMWIAPEEQLSLW